MWISPSFTCTLSCPPNYIEGYWDIFLCGVQGNKHNLSRKYTKQMWSEKKKIIHYDCREAASERYKKKKNGGGQKRQRRINHLKNKWAQQQGLKYLTLASKPVRNFRSFDLARTVARSPTEAACTTWTQNTHTIAQNDDMDVIMMFI